MDIPGELRLVRDATARLLVDLGDLDDEELAAESSLPGWSRADILRHLTDDARARAGSAPSGETPAPVATSSADIAAELASASEYLADTWALRSPDAWGRRLDHMRRGPSRSTSEPASRLVEVAVHHVDLDIGARFEDWPPDVVDVALSHVMATLAQRHARVGGPATVWRLVRTDGDERSAPGSEPESHSGSGPAGPPAGWMVVRASYGTEVHPVPRSQLEATEADADASVIGPGRSLLAWVLGRRSLDHPDLTVSGDADLAEEFPLTYAY